MANVTLTASVSAYKRESVGGEDLATIRAGAQTGTGLEMNARIKQGTPNFTLLKRLVLSFPMASVPAGSTINSAYIFFNGSIGDCYESMSWWMTAGTADRSLCFVSNTAGGYAIANYGATPLCDDYVFGVPDGDGYRYASCGNPSTGLNFNSTGKSYLAASAGGTALLGARWKFDVDNNSPSVSGGTLDAVIEFVITSGNIKLYIDYTPPSPPIAPSLLTATCVGGIGETDLAAAPIANFTMDVVYGVKPLTVAFTNTSTGSGLSYLYEFGDLNTSTSANPTNIYLQDGIYTPRLTVTDSLGRTSTIIKRVVVTSEAIGLQLDPPVANFTATPMIGVRDSGTGYLTVAFTNTSTGTVTSHSWTVDGVVFSTSASPSRNFPADGVYVIELTESNAEGFTSTISKTIVVASDPDPADNKPTSTIVASVTTGFSPLTVDFSATSSTPDVSYLWDFGDGISSEEASTPHQFGLPGTYEVTLTTSNIFGSTQAHMTIIVQGQVRFTDTADIGTYILDRKNNRILMYGTNNVYAGAIGEYGSTAGKFNNPTTLYVSRPIFGR